MPDDPHDHNLVDVRQTGEGGAAARRADFAAGVTARTGIDDVVIERLVHEFYARVRSDPLLGPVFAERITDWTPHLERMRAFWSSVVLMTGRYHGRPMPAHATLPITELHFTRWLALFEATAREICTSTAAEIFIGRAHLIAANLSRAVAIHQGRIPSTLERIVGRT